MTCVNICWLRKILKFILDSTHVFIKLKSSLKLVFVFIKSKSQLYKANVFTKMQTLSLNLQTCYIYLRDLIFWFVQPM